MELLVKEVCRGKLENGYFHVTSCNIGPIIEYNISFPNIVNWISIILLYKWVQPKRPKVTLGQPNSLFLMSCFSTPLSKFILDLGEASALSPKRIMNFYAKACCINSGPAK